MPKGVAQKQVLTDLEQSRENANSKIAADGKINKNFKWGNRSAKGI